MVSAETAEPGPAELETNIFRGKKKEEENVRTPPPISMISKLRKKETKG